MKKPWYFFLMRGLLVLLLSIMGVLATIIAFVLLDLVLKLVLKSDKLCDALGGSFEGNCAYVVWLLAVPIGAALAALAAAGVFSRRGSTTSAPADDLAASNQPYASEAPFPIPAMHKLWWPILALYVFSVPFSDSSIFGEKGQPLSTAAQMGSILLAVIFVFMSARELHKIGWRWFVALPGLFPHIGWLVLALLVITARSVRRWSPERA